MADPTPVSAPFGEPLQTLSERIATGEPFTHRDSLVLDAVAFIPLLGGDTVADYVETFRLGFYCLYQGSRQNSFDDASMDGHEIRALAHQFYWAATALGSADLRNRAADLVAYEDLVARMNAAQDACGAVREDN